MAHPPDQAHGDKGASARSPRSSTATRRTAPWAAPRRRGASPRCFGSRWNWKCEAQDDCLRAWVGQTFLSVTRSRVRACSPAERSASPETCPNCGPVREAGTLPLTVPRQTINSLLSPWNFISFSCSALRCRAVDRLSRGCSDLPAARRPLPRRAIHAGSCVAQRNRGWLDHSFSEQRAVPQCGSTPRREKWMQRSPGWK